MSFINKLKSVFIVDETNENASSEVASSENVKKTDMVSDVTPGNDEIQKFVDVLFKALETKNVEGFDYLEFMQSINNLKKQNLTDDEIKLFQTGFALAKTLNVDKNALIASGKHYMNVLEEEKSNFHASLTNNAKAKLDEKSRQIQELEKSLAQDKAKLESLRNEIMKNEQRKLSLTEELTQAEIKVNSVKSAFNTAYVSLSDKIKNDLDKIEKYL
ncbi:MAG: hypothetical protein ACM3PT_02290 [Deltaproteobacteria bacterium]